jgi:2-oxoisovalerate dehydrogenase E1 component alpha subunit
LTLSNQYPHYKHEFMSSGLFRPGKNAYPDMSMMTKKKKPADAGATKEEEAAAAQEEEESYTKNTLLRAHRQMIRLRKMDTILHNAQRQGRISFYMTHHGEEAIHMGSASALSPHDTIFAQYREAGLLMWRGFTLDQFCNQCFSNVLDLGKGRQMPVHYGCRALNYQTVSSPLGTQLTQAVGAAYKFKLDAMKSKKESGSTDEEEERISIVYFGEGAASTIDFHSACNFAATLKTPMIFFCRNNGYAISTPVEDQYAGDGIISRAPGYGMAGIRVDGNDIFAVHAAVAQARMVALETSAPVMIEAMTYRQGHHSTSDDSSRYRAVDEVTSAQDVTDPILRMDRFLRQYGWMDDNAVASIEDEERVAVLRAMEGAESRSDPKLDTMFTDVYNEKPPHLIRQEMELVAHLKRHNIAHD